MEIIELKDRSPIKMWTRGVCVEEKALEQLRNLSSCLSFTKGCMRQGLKQ